MSSKWFALAALVVGILVGGAASLLLFGGDTDKGPLRHFGSKSKKMADSHQHIEGEGEGDVQEVAVGAVASADARPQPTPAGAQKPEAPAELAADATSAPLRSQPAPACPVCPEPNAVCKPHTEQIKGLRQQVDLLQKEVTKARKLAKGPGYEGPTSADRRFQAAQDNNMFLDFPAWSDGFELSLKTVEELSLSPEDKAELERLYREFTQALEGKLRELLVELTGDVNAGADSTINALLHNVLQLSPQGACRERMLVSLQLIVAKQPLPEPGPDAPACEIAVFVLYSLVDKLEAEVSRRFGEKGLKALWSGASSFTFSAQPSP